MNAGNIFYAIRIIAALALVAAVNSCQSPFYEGEGTEDLFHKSSLAVKPTYIVQIEDAELISELGKTNGYEKKEQVVNAAVLKIMKRAGITDGEIERVYSSSITGFAMKIPKGQIKKLQDDPAVIHMEEDRQVSLGKPSKPGSPSPSQIIPWGILRVGGPGDGTRKKVGTAWVIDSGIDMDHPDLNVDGGRSVSFAPGLIMPEDGSGHGTHVAGIIAAKDNAIGVVGVAAGAALVAVKVLNNGGSGWNSDIIKGVDYVAANGAKGDVANMSLGGGVSEALDNAVYEASLTGIKFVLAAGNEAGDANNHSPARVNGENIYTVSAMSQGDHFASWSNYGNPPVDFCAPGVSIASCYKNGGYATWSGTSMAAPHVAGILLLGTVKRDGYVNDDPDGNPDPVAHR